MPGRLRDRPTACSARDEIEAADVGRGRGDGGAEIARAKAVSVDVDENRRRPLSAHGAATRLHHDAAWRDGDVAETAARRARNRLERTEGSDRPQAGDRGAASHHLTALVPHDPDGDWRARGRGIRGNDGRLIDTAGKLRERRECRAAVGAQQRHDIADAGVDVGEKQVTEAVPRRRRIAAGGRPLPGVAVGDRLVGGIREGPRQAAVGAAHRDQTGTAVVARGEQLIRIRRVLADGALAVGAGLLRQIDVGSGRQLPQRCRRDEQKRGERTGDPDTADGARDMATHSTSSCWLTSV